MSHHSTPRSNPPYRQHQQQSAQIDENNDSLLDESNSFDLKNQIYQLTSKYNNLEYEKNKILMSYENVLKEQKQKYTILERVCAEKQEKEEKLNYMVTELRSKCAYLTQENEALKKELHSLFEKNRITPDFNTIEMAQEMNMLGDLLDKEERMQKLDRQLQDAKENEYNDLKDKIIALQKENKKLKESNLNLEAQKKQAIKIVKQEAEDYHKDLIKFKDATIQELKNEQFNLALQLDQAKQSSQKNSLRGQELAQNRKKEEKIGELEEKINVVQRQRMRTQSENNDLLDDNKRLQNEKKMLQRSKKSLQQEIYLLTNEISQVRAAAFNDKIECKKQVNSIKLQLQEEKNKLRSLIDEKTQENKRLREGVLTLNDQNQELRDRHANQSKQIEKLMQENRLLSLQNERMLRESNKWEVFAGQSTKRQQNTYEFQQKIAYLEQQLTISLGEAKQKSSQLKELANQLTKSNEELHIRQQLVQIMKIEKRQFDDKLKESAKKLQESESARAQKQKVITGLQSQIRTLKDDNRQLQLANEQINEKLETMKLINSDIENIKNQLQLEKRYYQQMRREQEQLRKKHQRSESFKLHQENSKESKPVHIPTQSEQSVKINSIEQSRERDVQTNKQIELLKTQNYDLQVKLTEAENQINKKGIDINMKDEENTKLKALLNSPRELNFEPIIETSKKTQFNAVFLENKIMLLEKEILGLKNLKEKQYEEYKKMYRKKIQEKYLGEVKRSSLYINELEKNIQLLNNKLQYEAQTNKQLSSRLQQITKENYQVKCDYSDTLEELNNLLQKYKVLEGQLKELEFDRTQIKKIIDQNTRLKSHLDKLSKNTEEKALRLNNANDQIQKLNQTLMIKQSEIKMLKVTSPNSSFIGSQRGEQKSAHLNLPVKEEMEMEPSSDSDSLRSWVKKCPNYSRV